MDVAYFPYLVADGEEGDGHDDKDGEEEVEGEPVEVVGDAVIQGKGVERCYYCHGHDDDDDGTDDEQAQVIPAEQTHDVPRVGTMNLAQGHFLLSAT